MRLAANHKVVIGRYSLEYGYMSGFGNATLAKPEFDWGTDFTKGFWFRMGRYGFYVSYYQEFKND